MRISPPSRSALPGILAILVMGSTPLLAAQTEPVSWLDKAKSEVAAAAVARASVPVPVAAPSPAQRPTSWILAVFGAVLAVAVGLRLRQKPPLMPEVPTVGDGSGRRLVTAPGSTQLQLIRDPAAPGTRAIAKPGTQTVAKPATQILTKPPGTRSLVRPGTAAVIKPPSTRITRRFGFTMVEVIIAVAVMATALSALLSTVYTLNQAHQANRETAKAQELAQVLIERVQGGSWQTLGRSTEGQSDRNAWSWHRREGALPPDPPPLSEMDTTLIDNVIDGNTEHLAINNPLTLDPDGTATGFDLARADAIRAANGLSPATKIRGLGLWNGASGLAKLKVYLEYYDMALCADALSGTWQCNSAADWKARRTDPDPTNSVVLARDPATLDLSEVRNAVIFRVLLQWDSVTGGKRSHEVAFARRR